MLATDLGVALDTYLFPEPGRPQFVAVNTPFRRDRRWGGDNTDAYYFICPVDPQRRYRISGNKGDSVYFSVTAYNEPSPGAWSDRVVAIVRDTDLDIDADGNFSFEFPPTPDAAVLMTRDYQADPLTGRPVAWHIEALEEPDPIRHGDTETARGLRATATWLRTMFAIVPLAVGCPAMTMSTGSGTKPRTPQINSPSPIRCPTPTSAGRRATPATAYGSFVLDDDEALVITHRPPSCRFWNLVVWNQFMATYGATRRPLLRQRPQRRTQQRRLGDDRFVPRDDGPPEFADDAGLSAGQPGVPVVPRRRGAGAARGGTREGVRRADGRGLSRPDQFDRPAQRRELGLQRLAGRIQPHGVHAGVAPDRQPRANHLLGPDQGGGQHHLVGHQGGRAVAVAALPALAHRGGDVGPALPAVGLVVEVRARRTHAAQAERELLLAAGDHGPQLVFVSGERDFGALTDVDVGAASGRRRASPSSR